jgi:hypothetical protein
MEMQSMFFGGVEAEMRPSCSGGVEAEQQRGLPLEANGGRSW